MGIISQSSLSRSSFIREHMSGNMEITGIENLNFVDDDGNVASDVPRKSILAAQRKSMVQEMFDDALAEKEEIEEGPLWPEMSTKQKFIRICINLIKSVFLIGFLYFFICALDILGSAFRLMAGQKAGELLGNDSLISNPIAALMIGIVVTVLLQSSSTSTSIVVTMVGANSNVEPNKRMTQIVIIKVNHAIFIIMGANIGTSVTSTIVAMSQIGEKEIFRRAFAGGTVHDMFNWLTVIVLLPLEAASGYLLEVTGAIVATMNNTSEYTGGEPQMLQVLTRPLTDLIVQVNEEDIASASNTTSLLLKNCSETVEDLPCKHLFMSSSLSDLEIGLILLFTSLVVISVSLILLVKMLNTMLRGSVAKAIKKFVNYDLPSPFTFLTGYLALFVGAGLTILVQSSSVFTATLTPLVGLGIIELERMYPLTLGSNIGTTFTSILAALASPSKTFSVSLQAALTHLFFNASGVCLWYVVPYMRRVPIGAAKALGDITAKYRWFGLVYILSMFLIMPGFIFLLSWLGWEYLAGIGGSLLLMLILIIIITYIQRKNPKALPVAMRSWRWLPEPLRSLRPMDRAIRNTLGQLPCCACLTAEHDSAHNSEQRLINMTTFAMSSESLDNKPDVTLISCKLGDDVTLSLTDECRGHAVF